MSSYKNMLWEGSLNISEVSNSMNNEEITVTKLTFVFVQFQLIEPLHKMRDCGLQTRPQTLTVL